MAIQIAKRMNGVSESATLKLNALVQEMKAQGKDIVNLTAGEPDFPPSETARQAVIEAVKQGKSKYTPASGILELRELVARKTNEQQPRAAAVKPWKATDVVITNGGKQALFNALLALVNPGDEVLFPSPYWLSYPEMTKVAEGKPYPIASTFESGFKITADDLTHALNQCSRAKVLILNSPSNPTGAMYTREEFVALAHVIETHANAKNLTVISDEIYDRVIVGELPFVSFLEAAPELRDRVMTVNGMSKSAAMTGWRIGWSVASQELTQAMGTLQGQSTSGINALAQWASVAALKQPESDYTEMVEKYRVRRGIALEILKKTGKLRVFPPQGAFYLWVGVGAFGNDSAEIAESILKEAQVAVVPGTPFGSPDYVRLSFATDERTLSEGCERLVRWAESR